MVDHTDTELLDYLQEMLDQEKFTGKAILRWSNTGRGMRLHETKMDYSVPDIREAIENHMKHGEVNDG